MSGIDLAACDALAQSPRQPLVTVLGWMRAAALAEQHGLPVSSHLFCAFSAHLLAVTPTCQFLEYADWADPHRSGAGGRAGRPRGGAAPPRLRARAE